MILLVYFIAGVSCTVQYDVQQDKRDTAGALDIANNDRAIHTDIKPDENKVSTQNYYHAFETEKDGAFEFLPYREVPEPLFGFYGNPTAPQRPAVSGNNGNIQRPMPHVLHNYPIAHKSTLQEVPVKNMNAPHLHDVKDVNKDLKPKLTPNQPKVETYLVAHKPNQISEAKNVKLPANDNDKVVNNINTLESEKKETNHREVKYENHTESMKNQTNNNPNKKETASNNNLRNVDSKKDNTGEITQRTIDSLNIQPNKDISELQLIGEPFIKIMNLNIGDSLQKTNPYDNKLSLGDPGMREARENVKQIEITLPETDTTTIIVSSRKDGEPSKDTNKPSLGKETAHQQVRSANKSNDKSNLIPSNKAIEANERKPLELNHKMSSHTSSLEGTSPLYAYLYPYNMLYPKL